MVKEQTFEDWYVAVVEVCDKDGTRYQPGDSVPGSLVKKNRWLLKSGKVK